jgi:hypothetical protein
MLAAEQAKAQTEKERKVARNEERNHAKALNFSREVTKGAGFLKALELFGNPKRTIMMLSPNRHQ